jgi:hypothetical protein
VNREAIGAVDRVREEHRACAGFENCWTRVGIGAA